MEPTDLDRLTNRTTYVPPVTDYRGHIYIPIETKLGQCDEVISLLAALGADVDVPIKSSTVTYMYMGRFTLLQWTSKAISILESKTLPKHIQVPTKLSDSPTDDTWSEYCAYLIAVLPHCKTEDIGSAGSREVHHVGDIVRTLDGENASAMKDYLTFAQSILRAHGAILPEGASASEQPAPVASQGSGYIRLGKYTTTPVPFHLKVFYDELYEACWKADNASIREICLPKQVAEGEEPNPNCRPNDDCQ